MPDRLDPREAAYEINLAARRLYMFPKGKLRDSMRNRIRYLLKHYPLEKVADAAYAVRPEVDDDSA